MATQQSTAIGAPSKIVCHDILADIMSFIHPGEYPGVWCRDRDEERERKLCLRTLASAAMVCRMFSEHAQDVLWAALDDIEPLLRLLPLYRHEATSVVRIISGYI